MQIYFLRLSPKYFAAFSGRIIFFKTLILFILLRKTNKISVLKNILGLCEKYSAAFGDERQPRNFFP